MNFLAGISGGQLGLTALLAVVLLPLVSLLKQEHWPDQVKFAISLVVAAAVGFGQVALQYHTLTMTEFLAHFTVGVAAMQTAYRLYFAGSPFDKYLTTLGQWAGEAKTDTTAVVAVDPKAKAILTDLSNTVEKTVAPVATDPLPVPTGAVASTTTVDASVVTTPVAP